jgi:hypothetical protein
MGSFDLFSTLLAEVLFAGFPSVESTDLLPVDFVEMGSGYLPLSSFTCGLSLSGGESEGFRLSSLAF